MVGLRLRTLALPTEYASSPLLVVGNDHADIAVRGVPSVEVNQDVCEPKRGRCGQLGFDWPPFDDVEDRREE